MMHRLASLIFAGVALAACEAPSTRPSAPSLSDRGATQRIEPPAGETVQTFDGGFTVTYATRPEQIPTGEIFAINVQVSETASGRNVGDAVTLSVDGRMPHHRHGMNTTPVVRRLGPGVFHVDGMQFHMPGRWELSFDITRGGVTERALVVVMLE